MVHLCLTVTTPCDGEYNNDNMAYKWYKINNEEEFEILGAAFPNIEGPKAYPELICLESEIETSDSKEFSLRGCVDEVYDVPLSVCTKYVVDLYDKLGFDVEIKERVE